MIAYHLRTIEVKEVIIGTCDILLFVNNSFNIGMNASRTLNTQSQTACWTALRILL